MNPVHYFQRTSGRNYLKVGRKGNAKWSFSETFNWLSPGFDLNNVGFLKQADILSNETGTEFRETNPWKIFRSNTLTFTQLNQWNYGGKPYGNSFTFAWKSMFMNRQEANIIQTYGGNKMDSRRLRGGPDILFGEWYSIDATLNTDKAKRIMFMMQYTGDHNLHGDYDLNTFAPSLTFRLGNHVYLTGKFNYAWNADNMQYASTVPIASQSEPVYIVGHIAQKTYGLTMKLQVNVTPDISLQWYAAPFTSTAKYNNFKKALNPDSRIRGNRFYAFSPDEISFSDGNYTVLNNSENYTFVNPDFNFNEFRSNLVARWEYRPGSTLYIVWQHSMSNQVGNFLPGWDQNLERMFGLPSTNVFMIKLNYWYNL